MARTENDRSRLRALLLGGACVIFLEALAVVPYLVRDAVLTPPAPSPVARAKEPTAQPKPVPDDLAAVPEVVLEWLPSDPDQAGERLARIAQRARFLDAQDTDGFVKVLLRDRPDLRGLPFQMGHLCRMAPERVAHFGATAVLAREALEMEDDVRRVDAVTYIWDHWGTPDTGVGLAALTQIFAPESVGLRDRLVKLLGRTGHPAATRALARTAVFDADADIRSVAVDALKGRWPADYAQILLQALRHPRAAAARNAAQAIIALDRRDLLPELVTVLEEPGPCGPLVKVINGKAVVVVREVVKVNHHRNCLLCHAPAPTDSVERRILTDSRVIAAVPTPGSPLPARAKEYYAGGEANVSVRADVTYLRQDFSLMQPVKDAWPWPAMQRFDYLVRTRVLTDEEIRDHQKRKLALGRDRISANHWAVLEALRRLTGQDLGTNVAAWRDLVDSTNAP
jgi:hypothetical protein